MAEVTKLVADFLSGKQLTNSEPTTISGEDVVRADASQESEALSDYGTEPKSSDSTQDDLLPGSDDTPTDSGDAAKARADSKPQTSDTKEVITVTGDDGKRRKIEIDYSNREAIKKAHLLANGARKWQADRDKAIQAKQSVETELTQVKQDWAALDQAFQKGPEHLFDLLTGKQGSFDSLVAKRLERQQFLRNASPDEIRALEAQEKADRTAQELDRLRKEQEDFKKQVTSEKEQAEERALESKIHPAFDKYRFADKLGNPDDEHMFDEMLWNSALKRLEPYETQGVAITPELIEREFRTVATSIRNRIGVQAEKKVSKVVEQKKREATENVQAKVMSGYKTGGNAQEARDLLKKGDLTNLLKGWGKYGSLFNNGKK